MDQKELVIVNALDADGCPFNLNYIKYFKEDNFNPTSDAVIRANQELLSEIITFCLSKVAEGYKVTVINCVFSNRQSFLTDKFNSEYNKTESFFSALEKMHRYLQEKLQSSNITVNLDRYLVSDSFHGLPAGTTFSGDNAQENKFIFDDSKLTIIIAQTARMLIQYPTASIIYRCFDDDRVFEFARTFDFLKLYAFWIHRNTTLQLLKYSGETAPKLEREIQGAGDNIDANYENTIKLMCYVTGCCILNSINVRYKLENNKTAIKRFEELQEKNINVNIQAEKVDHAFKAFSMMLVKESLKPCVSININALRVAQGAVFINIDSPLLWEKTSGTGDSIFHVIGLLDNGYGMEYIKLALKAGIDPNRIKNIFGEFPSDLLDDGKPAKSWLMLPTAQQLPEESKKCFFPYWDHIKHKEYIQVKVAFHMASSESDHDFLKEIEDLLNSIGEEFCRKLADLKSREVKDPNCIVLIMLIEEWNSNKLAIIESSTQSWEDELSDSEISDDENEPPRKKPRLARQFSSIWAQEPQASDDEDSTNDEVMKDDLVSNQFNVN